MRLEVHVLALYQPIVCLVISCCLTEAFIIAVDLDFVYRYVKCRFDTNSNTIITDAPAYRSSPTHEMGHLCI